MNTFYTCFYRKDDNDNPENLVEIVKVALIKMDKVEKDGVV